MKRIKNSKGFSLTELLVVIVILGILVSLAVPRYINSVNDAKVETCRANIRAINSAIAAYQAKKKGENPASLDDLVTAGYFDSVPTCPFAKAYALNDAKTGVNTSTHFAINWQTDATHVQ